MSLKFIKTGLKYNSRELLSNAIILFQNKPEPLGTTNQSLSISQTLWRRKASLGVGS